MGRNRPFDDSGAGKKHEVTLMPHQHRCAIQNAATNGVLLRKTVVGGSFVASRVMNMSARIAIVIQASAGRDRVCDGLARDSSFIIPVKMYVYLWEGNNDSRLFKAIIDLHVQITE